LLALEAPGLHSATHVRVGRRDPDPNRRGIGIDGGTATPSRVAAIDRRGRIPRR